MEESELVSVAFANDRVEAGMIQGILESAGIPSALQHVGIDGPTVGVGLLTPGGGAKRILVRADQAEEARSLLAETLVEEEEHQWAEATDAPLAEESRGRGPRNYNLIGAYARSMTWSLLAMAVAFGVFLLLRLV